VSGFQFYSFLYLRDAAQGIQLDVLQRSCGFFSMASEWLCSNRSHFTPSLLRYLGIATPKTPALQAVHLSLSPWTQRSAGLYNMKF
jgi:hypothetical protein